MSASASVSLLHSVLRNLDESHALTHSVAVPFGHGEKEFLSDMEELFGEDHPISYYESVFLRGQNLITCKIHISDDDRGSWLERFNVAWRITTHYWLKTGYAKRPVFPPATQAA
jgi:hypothetical protein